MFHLKTIKFGGIDWGNDELGSGERDWPCRTCRACRGREWGIDGLGDFNAEAQGRRVRRGICRVEHAERVEGVGSDSGGSVAPRRSKEE